MNASSIAGYSSARASICARYAWICWMSWTSGAAVQSSPMPGVVPSEEAEEVRAICSVIFRSLVDPVDVSDVSVASSEGRAPSLRRFAYDARTRASTSFAWPTRLTFVGTEDVSISAKS